MYLLDTNLVSELRKMKAGRADPGVSAWVRATDPDTTFVSTITLLELEAGVVAAEQRDPAKGGMLRHWFESAVLPVFERHTLVVDAAVARQCAAYRGRHQGDLADALIAATAYVHRLAVVTRNVRDFEAFGVRVLNPWAA